MKKLSLVLILLFSLVLSAFAADEKVCIFPDNAELKSTVSSYMNFQISSFKGDINTQDLLTEDPMLLEYICNKTDSDYLLIPVIEQISDYNYLRLYLFNKNTFDFSTVFEKLDRESDRFGYEAVMALEQYFSDSLIDTEPYNLQYSDHSIKLYCTNAVADIYLNDKYIGKTPLEVPTYTIPSNIKFCAQGFADLTVSINDLKTTEYTVTLIDDLKSDSSLFAVSQNKYYKSLALALLGWGSRIAVRSLDIRNISVKKALEYASLGFAVSSTAYLGYNIYDYFRTTQNTTP